jgi:hypothetical protein
MFVLASAFAIAMGAPDVPPNGGTSPFATLSVYDLEGTRIVHEGFSFPEEANYRDAFDAMITLEMAQKLVWEKGSLGGKTIVRSIEGIRQQIPATGWILTHTHDGAVSPNVSPSAVHVQAGDALEWRLVALAAPRPGSPAERGSTDHAPLAEGGAEL